MATKTPKKWYYYAQNGNRHGPVTSGELRALAGAGKLLPTDLVWRAEMKDWKPASKVRGLFREASASEGPPPLPEVPDPPVPPPAPESATAAGGYYLATKAGPIKGPYSAADLRRMVREGSFDYSWKVSKGMGNWCPGGQVRNLVPGLEAALAEHLPAGEQYRSLTRTEVVALFLDKFVLNNENFKDTFPGLQQLRVWWAKLTIPKGFVITEVTGSGVRHVWYDVGTGVTNEVGEKQVDKEVAKGVGRFNWFVALAVVLGGVWLFWAAKDFSAGFGLTWGTLKTALLVGVALFGFVMRVKHSKVFVGYTLDEAALRRLGEVTEALRALRRCSRVWVCEVTEGGRHHWKYNAGDTFKVAKLPMAFFTRSIPNVETNVRVQGITHRGTALYFLPEKVLVVSGGAVYSLPYEELQVAVGSLEYVESEGHVYTDSRVVGHKWRYINRDGSRDRRFKDNEDLPVVRCGTLGLDAGGSELRMMTTDPDVPVAARAKLEAVKAAARRMEPPEAARAGARVEAEERRPYADDQLARIDRLWSEGLISEQEYRSLRRRILEVQ